MKLFTSAQLKTIDQYTIKNEPVSSFDLIERAALQFTDAFRKVIPYGKQIFIFAGPGNNGADALTIARILSSYSEYDIQVYLLNPENKISEDCKMKKKRFLSLNKGKFAEINEMFLPPPIKRDDIIIDGIFGYGLNKPLSGIFATAVQFINMTGAEVYAIDLPSGLLVEDNALNKADTIVRATQTFSFQMPKLSFFFSENEQYVGKWSLLDIRLHPKIIKELPTSYYYTEPQIISDILKQRSRFAHKGEFGHALLIAGSKGKIGAAVLAAEACLRSGTGMLTCHIPTCGNDILQTSVPEAMTHPDRQQDCITELPETASFNSVGIGPGIGCRDETAQVVRNLIESQHKPVILDADALNIIADNPSLLESIPARSILTPHPKEFDRLAGKSETSFQRMQKAMELAEKINCYIILKGAFTAVITPGQTCFFNSTGNPGMATAGSGDVLTGILLGLMAQRYTSFETAILGVYLHGLAGDLAAEMESEESMIAGDIIRQLGQAYKKLIQTDLTKS